MFSLHCLVLLLCVSSGLSLVRVPQGSVFSWNSSFPYLHANTIDYRYPNEIVEPLPACPFEGVFPHPRDCTWYYRCHDRFNFSSMGLNGMYWRSYYQCEPGTAFSDALDQCVHSGDVDRCRVRPVECRKTFKNCKTGRVCDEKAMGSSFLQTIEYCEAASEICSGKTKSRSLCSRDQFYDKTNGLCISTSSVDNCPGKNPQGNFDKTNILCLDVVDRCLDMDVCRNGGPRKVERLCDLNIICSTTTNRQTTTSLCSKDRMFDFNTNRCVPVPRDGDACSAGQTTEKPRPVEKCTKQIERCSIKPDCTTKEDTLVCSGVFMCGNYEPRTSVCQAYGEVYIPAIDKCVPTSSTYHRTRTAVECVDTKTDPTEYIKQYVCKDGDTSIPHAQNHPELGCSQRLFCNNTDTEPEVEINGCDSFFQCEGEGSPIKKSCPSNTFFDYKTFKCVDPKERYGQAFDYCTHTSANVTVEISIKCNSDGAIPELDDKAVKYNCDEDFICDLQKDILYKPIWLCDVSFSCGMSDGVLKAIKKDCPKGLKFSPNSGTDSCKEPPTNLCKASDFRRILRVIQQSRRQ